MHRTKNEVSHIKGFFSKCKPNLQFPPALVTFTEEILDEKLNFLYNAVFGKSLHTVYMVLPKMKLYIYIKLDMNTARFDIFSRLHENSVLVKQNTVFKRPKNV